MPPEPPKITLKLGRATPTDGPAPQINGPDQNGHAVQNGTSKTPFGGSSSNPLANLNGLDRGRSLSTAAGSPAPSHAIAMKNEMPPRNSPAPTANYGGYRAVSQSAIPPHLQSGGMPPPSTPGLSNHSPYAQSYNHHANNASNAGFESKWRQPGKGEIDCMFLQEYC